MRIEFGSGKTRKVKFCQTFHHYFMSLPDNRTKSIVDCNEDMSESPEQPLEEKMAIPERGGEDHMDVSCQEESDAPGYVSLKSKGPGKPINIRCDEKLHCFSHGIQANSERSLSLRDHDQISDFQAELGSQFKDQSPEFLDKSTGQSVQCGIGSLKDSTPEECNVKDATWNVYTSNCFQDELEVTKKSTENEHKSFPDSEFRSQERVVSLSPENRPLHFYLSESPAKTKYRLYQEGSKKKIGMKKGTSPGKESRGLQIVSRERPYPNWMDIKLGEILRGKNLVNINGKKHQLKVSVLPVDEVPVGLHVSEQEEIAQEGVDPALTENIHAKGSKDRPPDESHYLGNKYQPPDCMPHYGAAAEVITAPDNFGRFSDKPLDLTIEKPLDLSMKRKSVVDTCQSQMSFTDKGDEISHELENASGDTTANIQDYRSRCSSVVSMDDKDVPLEDDLMETVLASDVTQQSPKELSSGDGNLPSLDKLTLESNYQQQAHAQQRSGIQDSSVKQEMVAAVKSLAANANVSLQVAQQLVLLSLQNRLKQVGIKQQHVPHSTCRISNVDLPKQQNLQTTPVGMQNDKEMEQDIPAVAFPNLQSLELANNEGGIFESKAEHMKYKLKNKILQKKLKNE